MGATKGSLVKVLVAYASRHGATAGIAERIAQRLDAKGFDTTSVPVGEAESLEAYDAFIVGSAAYMFHWLKDATRFVKRNSDLLAQRPVWFFSSGPLGTDLVDDKGQDVFVSTRPKEFEELEPLVDIQGDHVFFGAWDPEVKPKGIGERFVRLMPATRDALPAGDFRDWDAIEAWADEIGDQLRGSPNSSAT
jgi:menaquinone-dependent protoporphyrinogen oxidase